MVFEKYNARIPSVRAAQVTDETAAEIAAIVGGVLVQEIDPHNNSVSSGINVLTTFGNRRASRGDFVVVRPDGRYEVMNDITIHELFEKA